MLKELSKYGSVDEEVSRMEEMISRARKFVENVCEGMEDEYDLQEEEQDELLREIEMLVSEPEQQSGGDDDLDMDSRTEGGNVDQQQDDFERLEEDIGELERLFGYWQGNDAQKSQRIWALELKIENIEKKSKLEAKRNGKVGKARKMDYSKLDIGEQLEFLQHQINHFEDQGKLGIAEELSHQAIGLIEEKLGKQHQDIGTFRTLLGRVYRRQERYKEAESELSKAKGIWEKYARDEAVPEKKAKTLNELSRVLGEQNKFKEAVECCKNALRIRKELYKVALKKMDNEENFPEEERKKAKEDYDAKKMAVGTQMKHLQNMMQKLEQREAHNRQQRGRPGKNDNVKEAGTVKGG